jgi:cold shock protein
LARAEDPIEAVVGLETRVFLRAFRLVCTVRAALQHARPGELYAATSIHVAHQRGQRQRQASMWQERNARRAGGGRKVGGTRSECARGAFALLVAHSRQAVFHEGTVRSVPTGKVKWYDAGKGFGFVTQDGGADVYVRAAALPTGVTDLKAGQRVEFGVADGRRGPQALSVRLLEPPPSVAEARRRPAEELHGLIDDMIKLLESRVQPDLRRGRYPDRRNTKRVAEVVRAVASELDP